MERLKALEIFKAVAEHGSFTKAADAICLAVPSVTRAIQSLETLLHVQLFHRTTRSVTLTTAGTTVLEYALGVLDSYAHLSQLSNDIALDVSGEVRLEVSTAFDTSRLSRVLTDFLRAYPDVRVETRFVDGGSENRGDGADVSIIVGRAAPASCVARSLGSTRLGIYASPDYLASAGLSQHPGQTDPREWMALPGEARDRTWQLVDAERGEQSTVKAEGAFRTNCPRALLSAAEQGLGFAILPMHMAGAAMSRGTLVRVLNDWRPPSLDTSLVYPSRQNQPLRVRRLLNAIVDGCAYSAEAVHAASFLEKKDVDAGHALLAA